MARREWAYEAYRDRFEHARRDVVAHLCGLIPARDLLDIELVTGEACSNVARHSGSKTMRVAVEVEPGRVTLTVEDEGCGFCPDCVPEPDLERTTGRGLALMVGLSDCLAIESRPGLTVVRAEWRL